jgi:predicted nucleic acid-binding protein
MSRKLRIYLDTSVINFLYAEDAPDFQAVTVDFFRSRSHERDLFISRVVLAEIGNDPDESHRALLLGVLDEHAVALLPTSKEMEVESLAKAYLTEGAIPVSKLADALHVAYATIHGMDVLLSWNFKHLANILREERVLAVNIKNGYRLPLRIVSPLEMDDEDDEL